ncbi:MAG: CheB methylesterase domain-containing protein, partial [Tissierellaceae bacterium]
QHIPPGFSNMFAKRLNNQTHFEVKEGEDRDTVEPGKVIIAPGDKHMKIKNIGGKYKIEVYSGERVSGHCPSVDVLFNSVAKEVKSKAIGVILTGMGYDGAKGLLAMKRNGARTIGQDEKSSVVFGMPRVAQEVGAVQIQGSIDEIPKIIHSMSK